MMQICCTFFNKTIQEGGNINEVGYFNIKTTFLLVEYAISLFEFVSV